MQKINKTSLLLLSLLVSTTAMLPSNKENRKLYDNNKNVYGFYNYGSNRLSSETVSRHNGVEKFTQARENAKYEEARAINNYSPKKPSSSTLSNTDRRVVGSTAYSAFKKLS